MIGGDALLAAWRAEWPGALALWSPFTKLTDPRWCFAARAEKEEGLTGSFAMIRFADHAVVISLRQVRALGLDGLAREILAHEIGHHVYAPGDLADHGRMLARMRRALPGLERHAPMVANLYTDLLINDRLQRSAGLRMDEVYRRLGGSGDDGRLWTLYMRIYERLWSLEAGSLSKGERDRFLELDAGLGARLVRVYAKDWLSGSGRFASLCFSYLLKDTEKEAKERTRALMDTENAGKGGGVTGGLAEAEEDEAGGAVHPRYDPALGGVAPDDGEPDSGNTEGGISSEQPERGPVDFHDLLASMGVEITLEEATVRFYREKALPHLTPFPRQRRPRSGEPLPEGLETWELGSPLDGVDWLESVIASPVIVPGFTTLQRTWGFVDGEGGDVRPLDLYIGVDCSGSMLDPRHNLSFPVLAGTILALSALRAGARVMVVLSGEPGRYVSTEGFMTDERRILGVLTGYLGTGTTFGIQRLAETFGAADPERPPAHILLITDNDIFSMLEGGEKGGKGWDIARNALVNARGGGTMVLHSSGDARRAGRERLKEDGWSVHRIVEWKDIVAFATAFAQAAYDRPEGDR
ncbi:MAG: VWA domain-containing protein [Alphaproteobacteria bacterium]|nr:VWA domain-containing protein [Alphaproteobacteria bacterium]